SQADPAQGMHSRFTQFVILVQFFHTDYRLGERYQWRRLDFSCVERSHDPLQCRRFPGAWFFGTMERITNASFSSSEPLRTAKTSVNAWSVMPRDSFTGISALSGPNFQTTAVSLFGARGRFWGSGFGVSDACTVPEPPATTCCPLPSIPYCL